MRHPRLLRLSLSLFISAAFAQDARVVPIQNDAIQIDAIQKVDCAGTPGQSYMLYLPPGYPGAKTWPILYAFDPGARGNVPAERFKAAAAKFGYIIASSNNSRNGLWQISLDAITAVWTDTHARLAIDERRIYTTGHSGGARVAFAVASGPAKAAGVIAGGAGMPGSANHPKKVAFATYALAGDADFNYVEVSDLYQNLQAIGATARLHVFEGPHQWAPSEAMIDALAWMEIQAMRAGLRARDEALLDEWVKAKSPSDESLTAWRAWTQLALDLRGMRDVGPFEAKAAAMKDSKVVKSGLKAERSARDKETGITTSLSRSVRGLEDPETRDDSARQLHAAVADLKKHAAVGEDSPDRRVTRRALAGLSAQLREANASALEKKDYILASIRLDIAAELPSARPQTLLEAARVLELAGNKKRAQYWRDRAAAVQKEQP